MMNPGPGGYLQRTVDKTALLPGIYWLKEVKVINVAFNVVAVDTLDWKRVETEKNEMGIRYQ